MIVTSKKLLMRAVAFYEFYELLWAIGRLFSALAYVFLYTGHFSLHFIIPSHSAGTIIKANKHDKAGLLSVSSVR